MTVSSNPGGGDESSNEDSRDQEREKDEEEDDAQLFRVREGWSISSINLL
jgi:hypothetical protein